MFDCVSKGKTYRELTSLQNKCSPLAAVVDIAEAERTQAVGRRAAPRAGRRIDSTFSSCKSVCAWVHACIRACVCGYFAYKNTVGWRLFFGMGIILLNNNSKHFEKRWERTSNTRVGIFVHQSATERLNHNDLASNFRFDFGERWLFIIIIFYFFIFFFNYHRHEVVPGRLSGCWTGRLVTRETQPSAVFESPLCTKFCCHQTDSGCIV
jgi:hypothetical protein